MSFSFVRKFAVAEVVSATVSNLRVCCTLKGFADHKPAFVPRVAIRIISHIIRAYFFERAFTRI